jgi:hypothetical protein
MRAAGGSVPRLLWGIAATAVYVAAVWGSAGGLAPARVLFDGFAPPQPYRWVSPPPPFASSNQPPEPASQENDLGPTGSEGISVATGDGQASLVAAKETFPPVAGQRSVLLRITASLPESVGPPPSGMQFDGNAYTFTAAYQPSGDEAPPEKVMSVLLRYPVHATVLLRWDGARWVELQSTTIATALQVYAQTDVLGTFAAAAPKQGRSLGWLPYVSVGAIVLAGLAGLTVRLRERRRKPSATTRGVSALRSSGRTARRGSRKR